MCETNHFDFSSLFVFNPFLDLSMNRSNIEVGGLHQHIKRTSVSGTLRTCSKISKGPPLVIINKNGGCKSRYSKGSSDSAGGARNSDKCQKHLLS
jgi:hypothetical protein